MKNLGERSRTRWTTALLIMVLVVSLGSMTSAASVPAGPLEVQVTERENGRAVDLNGEVLVLNLESNPSTGYGWQVQGLNPGILRQLDAIEWLPDTPGKLGGSGTEVLRFAATGRGRATLNLVYARPWETAAAPAKSFSLEVNVTEPSRNVSYPQPAIQEPLEAMTVEESLDALPSSLNWCDQGGCTPVRDQGNCGSCWAFGTVGPLESAILIQDGLSKDLAEQYLVSCNTDGWGCDGGWWAHDYHEWKYPAGEPGPGAVYEADFPYTATDAPCNPPHPHHETITDWVFIAGENSVPTTAALKQAIYDHGPVSAALCVNNTFKAYTGGVFEPALNWCFTINHAITLVGWDDSLGSQGAWRLRNSWGDDWGEGGYMWIAYGTYSVGYSANYVVYEGSTPPTPPAAPSSLTAQAVSSNQINLAWTDNADNETGFKIERCTGAGCSDFSQIATVGANVTSYSNTGLAASTSYSFRVRATNEAGDSGYSNTASATTDAPPSPPAAPSSLTAEAVSTSQIDLAWTDNADNETGFKIERCNGAGCNDFAQIATVGANVTSYSNTGLAASTSYSYRVRATNDVGDSGYSNEGNATTEDLPQPPAAPSGLEASVVSSSQIDLTWTDNASNENGFTIERSLDQTNWSEVGDVGAGVTSYQDSGLDASTTYCYRVCAYNVAGDSAYSNVASATTQAQGGEDVAAADYATTYGSVAGTYVATQAQDNVYQAITEVHSGGKPSARYDQLEHIWRFDLTGGNHVFHVDAYYQEAGDADSAFVFSWSPSSTGPWTDLVTVVKIADDNGYQVADLGSPSGTIYIRVVDNDRTPGQNSNDTLYVDHMYVDGGVPPTELPDPATNPEPADGATDVTTTPALGWTAGAGAASHDVYFGTNPAPGLAEFKGNQPGTSFSPDTLNLNTTYYWRIDEVNSVGTTTGAVWSFTTRSSEEPQTVHVFSAVMSGKRAGANRFATAVITIHDNLGNPVSGATVYGTWSGDYAGMVNGVTGADGTVSFTSGNVKVTNASFTFTVDDIVLAGYTYDPNLNGETWDTIVVP